MSWRSGAATAAVLSLVLLPLSITSASADDTVPTPSASATAPSATQPTGDETTAPAATAEPTDSAAATPQTDEPKTLIITFEKAQSDPAKAAEAAVATIADRVADAQVTKVTPITNSTVAVTLDSALTTVQTSQVEDQVSNASGIKAAQASGWFRPAATNDASYDNLWNLNSAGTYGTHAEDAWPSSTGASTIVGVIDTGITGHPDLTGSRYRIVGGNVIDGYDFITNACFAGDGGYCKNGRPKDNAVDRDSNPTDTGDFYSDSEGFHSSSWHGTHVAGIIAAMANNGIGVAGVAPNTKIEPLRALGRSGGDEADVIAAIYWGAGLSSPAVSKLPANPQPADVLNLSLGMAGDCSVAMQDAINAATAKGVIVVAAAGNGDLFGNGLPVSESAPANCKNVISVGATTRLGTLAGYSNYGNASQLTISAPGGGDGVPAEGSIYSTLNGGLTVRGSSTYGYMSGTSMAAPHVAATIALLKSLNPSLGFTEVKQLLTSTANPSPSCGQCGAGRLDSAAAVASLVASLGVTPASAPLQTGVPRLDGLAQVGRPLQVSVSAAPTASLTYQWYRDSGKITGATAASYTLAAADKGSHVLVKVTAASGTRKTIQLSPATATVAAGVITSNAAPKASGTFKVGRTVSASKGSWSPTPSSFSYRWLRSGKSISGATKSKYKLTSKDRGKRISVRVTVKKSAYSTTSATSSSHTVKR